MKNTQLNVDLIQRLVSIIEAKDDYTQGHSHHVYVIVKAIYDCLPAKYQNRLNKEQLFAAALLHDIGKTRISDAILNKESSLNDEEWEIMRMHPKYGEEILKDSGLNYMSDWILYHHERIDGNGYYSLKGQDIPLESRIIAIADIFSALRTYRSYRPAKGITETVQILKDCRGTQLDAEILDYFLTLDIKTLEVLECNCEICKIRRQELEAKQAALAAAL